jgi:two-component system CheB/CheR fusion protein
VSPASSTAARATTARSASGAPGCSTGEEAYSLAIALLEFLGDRAPRVPVQIFATDVSEPVIERARAGVYAEAIAADVSPERLRRFFARGEEGGYRVTRSAVTSSSTPARTSRATPRLPASTLITCRNVLIYLGAPLQER